MGKVNQYYLVARDRVSNRFQIIPIHGKRGLSLEEIDLYTTHFQDANDLLKKLQESGILEFQDSDFYIVNQARVHDKTVLKQQELLFSKNRVMIEDIARNSLNRKISLSTDKIDAILDQFAVKVFEDAILFDQVVTGKTNIYSKYANYFSFNRHQGTRVIKYRDGAWARTSYPLIRNVLEAETRVNTRYARVSDQMYRHLLEEKIIRVTDDHYDENQLSFFEQIPDVVEDFTDLLVEVVTFFEHLPEKTFVFQDDHIHFNEELFSSYQDGDLEKLKTYLPGKLQSTLQKWLLYRVYLEKEPQRFGDAYLTPIRKEQKEMIELLKGDSKLLQKAYLWCQLFDKYKAKDKGDLDARGFQKGKGNSGS